MFSEEPPTAKNSLQRLCRMMLWSYSSLGVGGILLSLPVAVSVKVNVFFLHHHHPLPTFLFLSFSVHRRLRLPPWLPFFVHRSFSSFSLWTPLPPGFRFILHNPIQRFSCRFINRKLYPFSFCRLSLCFLLFSFFSFSPSLQPESLLEARLHCVFPVLNTPPFFFLFHTPLTLNSDRTLPANKHSRTLLFSPADGTRRPPNSFPCFSACCFLCRRSPVS